MRDSDHFNLRIPREIRQRIGLPPAEVEVRFGAPDPLDSPGGYNYEISPEDRAVLEKAVQDSNGLDVILRTAAQEALRAVLNPLLPGIGGLAADFIINALGKLFSGSQSISAAAFSAYGTGMYTNYFNTVAQDNRTIMTSADLDVKTVSGALRLQGTVKVQTYVSVRAFGFQYANFGTPNLVIQPANFTIERKTSLGTWDVLKVINGSSNSSSSGSTEPINEPFPVRDKASFVRYLKEHLKLAPEFYEEPISFAESTVPVDVGAVEGQDFRICANNVSISVDTTTGIFQTESKGQCKVFGGGLGSTFDELMPRELESLEDFGEFGDPALTDLTPRQMTDLISGLKKTPWYDERGGEIEDPPVPPLPDPDPEEPGLPGEPGIGDPGLPCRAVGGPPLNSLKINHPFRGNPYGRFGAPDPGRGEDAFTPGKPFRYRLPGGAPGEGKIGNYRPPKNPGGPGQGVVTFPPYADEYFTKTRCYKNAPVTATIKALAKELGVDPNMSVDPSCSKRFTRCFKKGTSKFDAMWWLSDLCGYGVFPPPPGSGEVGPLKPLPVHHGPYHENRDLFVFSRVWDSSEVPSHIEVYKPPYRGKPGYDVVVPVKSPFDLPDDRWLTIVAQREWSKADALDQANQMADFYGGLGKTVEAAIPLNIGLAQRHQVKLRRPLMGFDANYMVLEFSHDIAGEGYITTFRGVELRLDRYARRFEYVRPPVVG